DPRRSLEKLKVALATTPVLAIVDPNKPFVLGTDANDRAIGAVLMQDNRPIAFESKKLDKAQQNYSVYERELYAIIYALKKWRHYLYGAEFEIVFDHESIEWFTQQTELKGQKARWAEFLQDFDCTLRYHKGRYNMVADALSHMPEVESLSFTELRSDLLASIQGKCEH
ncbi:Ty3/Gypsy family RNase HI domain-containing protein, partial [Escherichia coli]|uniref:Ty3/Gypsy family RNase HI domain-containing protein n=1 Tax=Escherichia coli TaxID=562 RepID=UPI00142E0F60